MTTHLSEEQLHDFAGAELAPEEMEAATAHLEACAPCRARLEPLLSLTARLAALPRAAAPAADGWCALHARLRADEAASPSSAVPMGTMVPLDAHRRRRALAGWVPQAAAAALLLGVGFGGGRLAGAPRPGEVLAVADTVATAMEAAVAVQRAGTEYVAAVAKLVAAAGGDTLGVGKGRAAAIAACYGATRELTRLRDGDSSAMRLFRAASATLHGAIPPDTAPASSVKF